MKNNTAKLTLHTNDKFKKVFKPSCTIKMETGIDIFEDFVVVGHDEQSGKPTIMHNADTLTLGAAMIMITDAFNKSYSELPEDMKIKVAGALNIWP